MPVMAYARITAAHVTPVSPGGKVHLRFVPEHSWVNQESLKPDCNHRARNELVVTDEPVNCLRCLENLGQYQRTAETFAPAAVRASTVRDLNDLAKTLDQQRTNMLAYARLANGTPEVGDEVLDVAERLRLVSALLVMSAWQVGGHPDPGPDGQAPGA